MSLFKIRIFKRHEVQYYEEGELKVRPNDNDAEWKRFDFYLETARIKIDYFEEYVLFDNEDNPTRCTKIYLSDGSFIFGCANADTFAGIYNNEYLKIVLDDYEDKQ